MQAAHTFQNKPTDHARAITKLGIPQPLHYPIGVKRVHVNSPNVEGGRFHAGNMLCTFKTPFKSTTFFTRKFMTWYELVNVLEKQATWSVKYDLLPHTAVKWTIYSAIFIFSLSGSPEKPKTPRGTPGSYRSYLQRAPPQALGSKEVPEVGTNTLTCSIENSSFLIHRILAELIL